VTGDLLQFSITNGGFDISRTAGRVGAGVISIAFTAGKPMAGGPHYQFSLALQPALQNQLSKAVKDGVLISFFRFMICRIAVIQADDRARTSHRSSSTTPLMFHVSRPLSDRIHYLDKCRRGHAREAVLISWRLVSSPD
jgi:hypothetical protein